MRKVLTIALLTLALAGLAAANDTPRVPEIDAGGAAAALGLLAGGLMVLRARRKQ
jgi:hypothetical protein